MDKPDIKAKEKNSLSTLYGAGFFLAFHLALLSYIESSFLATFMPEKFVGLIFMIAAIFAVIILSNVSKILNQLGNFVTISALLILEMVLLAGLAILKDPIIIIIFFILHLAIIPSIGFNFDIFLESNTSNKSTGGTRGTFLTFYNAAWIIPPLIAGFILSTGDYWKIFFLASVFIIPILILLNAKFDNFKDIVYTSTPFWKTLKEVWSKKDIYKIFISNLMLYFFFSWMVIYMPIYLHNYIGFEWSQIGIIFTIMLLPFVILEIPLGKLADSKLGEKELLIVGFIIMAISSVGLSFIDNANIFLWTIILFITRIGASMVLIMNETYFFKKVDAVNANLIGFFRNARPFAYIISPIIASIFLYFFELKFIFLALGVIMLLSTINIYTLRDTK